MNSELPLKVTNLPTNITPGLEETTIYQLGLKETCVHEPSKQKYLVDNVQFEGPFASATVNPDLNITTYLPNAMASYKIC